MSSPQTWTTYTISSAEYWDNPLILSTQHTPSLTDVEAFSAASGIATALGVSLGIDVLIDKIVWTQNEYSTDYSTGVFS
jgi:hypothetical protein